jgi:hypothetical protein
MHAFQKARLIGDGEEDSYLNNREKPVQWKFIDVAELHPLSDLSDGAEIYSRICEEDNAVEYIRHVSNRSKYLHESCLQKTFQMN